MELKSKAAGLLEAARAFIARTAIPVSLLSCATFASHAAVHGAATPTVEIRRTTDGIPHLRAHDWRSLGFGIGYVQAQDALCTLAEGFVTYQGQRSLFFGPDAHPERDSTFGRPKNLDLDVFFRGVAPPDLAARYRARQVPELVELIEGYASGYNRYLHEPGRVAGASGVPRRQACIGQPWVRDIGPDDIYRRLYALQIAAGYAHFIPEIASASPSVAVAARDGDSDPTLPTRLARRLGTQDGLGSNMMAFGTDATGGDGAVLFGNPHWYWGGPDRFYQMHLTIPGHIDVAGVAMLGVPVVMIGFNERVAWSHTVSAARRFGLFDLTLDATDPKRYLVDGVAEPMQQREVAIQVRQADGHIATVTRTLYRSRFGPLIDLGAQDDAFGWRGGHAISIRDVNDENFRVFSNFLEWDRAESLDDFIAIQKREVAMPWVNTMAIGRGDGRVWYADIGAVPNASDALRTRCGTPRSEAFAQVDAAAPMLDGSRSACDWEMSMGAAVRQALPVTALPALIRKDEVANMNDSHWLANPDQALEGYPSVLGGERQPLSLRSRVGHELARSLARRDMRTTVEMRDALMRETLTSPTFPAEHFKDAILAHACAPQADDPHTTLVAACALLKAWSGASGANDRGSLLWDAFWSELQKLPSSEFYRIPFSSDEPIDTPRTPAPTAAQARQSLTAALASLTASGLNFDAAVGDQLKVRSGDRQIALFGGCAQAGHFAVTCVDDEVRALGPDAVANSYLQVVRFDKRGVDARTLLAHGIDDEAVAGGVGSAPVLRYARKDWLRFPFSELELAQAAVAPSLILDTGLPLDKRATLKP